MPPSDTKHGILGFLRDYASITPSVIAIMNGLLAVYSTHYPFDAPGTKLEFIVIIGSLSFAAIAVTIYYNHLVLAARAKERARIIAVQEVLGKSIVDGDQLLRRFFDLNDTTVETDANQWLERVGTFLINELGQLYLARFQNSSGAPIEGPAESTITEERRRHWVYINQRLTRLQQFITESPHAW